MIFEVFSNLNDSMSALLHLSCPLPSPTHHISVNFFDGSVLFWQKMCVIIYHYCSVLDFLRPSYSVKAYRKGSAQFLRSEKLIWFHL